MVAVVATVVAAKAAKKYAPIVKKKLEEKYGDKLKHNPFTSDEMLKFGTCCLDGAKKAEILDKEFNYDEIILSCYPVKGG